MATTAYTGRRRRSALPRLIAAWSDPWFRLAVAMILIGLLGLITRYWAPFALTAIALPRYRDQVRPI